MIRIITLALTIFSVMTICTAALAHSAEIDQSLHKDLENISHKRIYFGHQSVGENLLEGIQQFSKMAGVKINVFETPTASGVKSAGLGNTFIARNGYPLQKLKSFNQAMGLQPTGLDIALMKFCFVDITPDTDVKELFDRYKANIDDLKAKNPGTIFVHVTAPLTTVQSGFKGIIKKLIGRAPYGAIENIRREEYNNLMRQTYQGHEPIFDLARIESTAPDGKIVMNEWKGIAAPAMAQVYTDDGGHLNDVGKLRAARELISILASTQSRTSKK